MSEHEQQSESSRLVPMVLIVLATVIAILSAATTWVRFQALDTDEWVDASAELLENEEVRDALAAYLVDELYTAVDVSAELESLLPEDLAGLAGPLAGALRGPATDGVGRVLASPAVERIWVEANERAHRTFVAIVRDETRPNISTSDGEVVLDLGAAVQSIGEQLGVPDAALDRIPADAGQITIFTSGQLADVQDAVRALDVLSWFLFVVVVALYAVAVYVAGSRRREALRDVGIALAVGGAVLLVIRNVGVGWAVDQVVDDPANESAAQVVGDVFTQLLHDMARTGIIIGLVIVLFAALLGPHRWARWIRQRLAAASNPTAIIAIGAIAFLLLLLWWSPGKMFERWVSALTILGMIAGGAFALAAAVRREPAALPAGGDSEEAGSEEAPTAEEPESVR